MTCKVGRQDILYVFQNSTEMEIIRGLHWDMYLVQYLELREAIIMAVKMVSILEGWRYVPLVVSQMGSLMLILVKVHWVGYLLHIVDLMKVLLMAAQEEGF